MNATDVFERYMYDASYDDVIDHVLPTLEVTEVSIGQTIEVPLTNTNKVVLSGNSTFYVDSNGFVENDFSIGNKTSSYTNSPLSSVTFRLLYRISLAH